MTDTVERFSNRVENYVKYRPDYPREIIGWLTAQGALEQDTIVADIGCGPGISTRMFLENGNRVFGVEPNSAMRAAASEYLKPFPNFKLIEGSSENTNLNDASIDLVTAAQAFHWFRPEPTRKEFERIIKPGGHAALIWNIRQEETTPFLIEYERLIRDHSADYQAVRHNNIGDEEVAQFLGPDMRAATFDNVQEFDFDGLLGRLLSSSYMPADDDARYPAMKDALRALFAKHEQDGKIQILYDTKVYLSPI
jgi:SAM-dependent methyltransferase